MSAVQVDYAVAGSGPAVYLVHGIGARKTAWQGLIPYLVDDFTCVTHDLRGHGQSPVPPVPFTLGNLVEDVELLRQRLGHEQIHIVGSSLGGMIAPAYAQKYPERCLSVGLLSTAAGRDEEDRKKLRSVGKAMREKSIREVLETLTQRWFTDDFLKSQPDVVEQRLQQVVDTPSEVFLEVFRIYAETEMAPWLHEIKQPCLVLTGELDGGCNPRLNRFIHAQLADSELVILEGLKHGILVEAPDRVAPHVHKFLMRHR